MSRHYSKTERDHVAQTDMVDFLATEYGWTITKAGSCYSTLEHDSIRIKSDRKLWYWNSRKAGGANVIDWLSQIEHMEYPDIMAKMLGTTYEPAEISVAPATAHRETKPYYDGNVPAKSEDASSKKVINYLVNVRNISMDIVEELVAEGKIYQDTKNNAVFANFNEQGSIGFWCLRGTVADKKFTRNMPGSNNPYYGFMIDSKSESDTLYVFEAPIDLLSHCTIADLKFGSGIWRNQSRIALCGVNDRALECYLPRHKNVRTIKFCLDNDDAGRTAAHKLMAKYYELGYKTQSITYKCPGKDINEMLCHYVSKTKEKDRTSFATAEEKAAEPQSADEKPEYSPPSSSSQSVNKYTNSTYQERLY